MEMLSDIEEGRTTGTCYCGLPAFYWIETDDDCYGKYRSVYCRECGDRKLEMLRLDYEESQRLLRAVTERLGYNPESFCEDCGYRFRSPEWCVGCRCDFDPLTGEMGYGAWWPRNRKPFYQEQPEELVA